MKELSFGSETHPCYRIRSDKQMEGSRGYFNDRQAYNLKLNAAFGASLPVYDLS